MKLGEVVSAKYAAVATGLSRLFRLERSLALVCLSIPLLLIAFDGGHVRDSISAYYDMPRDVVFYFPLTVASMLFVVNGVVKDRHGYNTFLGVMLAGVILFNTDAFNALHLVCAAAFFGGNVVVMWRYSTKRATWFKGLLVIPILVSMVMWRPLKVISLFWAEWLSFAMIAFHFYDENRDSPPDRSAGATRAS